MTINDIIITAEQLRPGSGMAADECIGCLNRLEEDIYSNIIACHEGAEPFSVHTEVTDVLLAPNMYADLYKFYMLAQIDLANGDITRYSNNMILYNNMLSEYRNWYTRNHMPLTNGKLGWC